MPVAKSPPTETSPLLSDHGRKPTASDTNDSPSAPVATQDAESEDAEDGDAENGNGVQRIDSTADRQRQYEGMPELRKRMKIMFPALAVGVFLSAVDQTIVASSQAAIGSDLNAQNQIGWIASAYFLTLTALQPLSGKLSDIFGRRPCLLFGYSFFGLGCLGCGLAPNVNFLIISRAVTGIGGAGMNTITSIILSDIIPLRERGTWQGYINIIFSIGASTGAPLGGVFADGPGWRWSFLSQVPLCVVAFIAVSLTLKMPKKEDSDWKANLKRIDFLGAVVLMCAVFSLLLGLDRGSNVAWATKECLIPLCLSFPLFVAFVFVEVKIASEPFAPGRIIFERSLFAAYLCNFFSFCGYLATIFYLPLYFQAARKHSASISGLLLIPSVISSVSGSLFAGFYMKKTGKFYWLTVCCYSGLTIGSTIVLLFSGIVVNSDLGVIIGMVIAGFSNGIGVTSTLISLIANTKRDDQALVTSASYLFRSLGSTTGISLSSTALNQRLKASLRERLGSGKDAAKIVEGVRKSLKFIKKLTPEQQSIVRYCYMLSSQAAFGLQIGLVAGAAISAWLLREQPLSK